MTAQKDDFEATAIQLRNGDKVLIEVRSLGGEEEVAAKTPAIDEVLSRVNALSADIVRGLCIPGANKITVEYGVSLAIESGAWLAAIAKSSASANFKVSVEIDAKAVMASQQ